MTELSLAWWQIYLLIGMVVIGWELGTEAYRQQIRPLGRGRSGTAMLILAAVGAAISVLIWPVALVYWLARLRA